MALSPLRSATIYTIIVYLFSFSFVFWLYRHPESLGFFPFLMLLPAVTAAGMRLWEKEPLRKLISPLCSVPSATSLFFSFLYPVAVIIMIAVIVVLFGIGSFDAGKLHALTNFPTLSAFAFGIMLVFGEEYGWRGYLLPRLAKAFGEKRATSIHGLIWAFWHAPIVLVLASFSHASHPWILTLVQLTAVVAVSYPFAWLYFRSGSIIPPMIFHYVWDLYNPIVLGNIYQNSPGIVGGNILWINGEGIAGIIVMLPFVFWYLMRRAR
jgi:membrane protease YdiL (CAAX protease family)